MDNCRYTRSDWEKASKSSIYNKEILLKSTEAACYYCLSQFKASYIWEYVDDDDITALCPHCGIDAVLGDATGLPIHNIEYLKAIHNMGFDNHISSHLLARLGSAPQTNWMQS